MRHHLLLTPLLTPLLTLSMTLALSGCATPQSHRMEDSRAIILTNEKIREAFVDGDIDAILKYHHPRVEKVLSWTDHQHGHDAMRKSLSGLFAHHRVAFLGRADDMDSLEILGDTAVMVAKFSVDGRPKAAAGQAFVFSGRTMIVYVRDARSPTGWLTYREVIVPEAK